MHRIAVDPLTRTVRVRGTVDNHERLLKAEMYVVVDIPGREDTIVQGVEVPARAVFLKDNRYYLFVQLSPGQYQRHTVVIKPEINGRVLILDGVSPGQKIVTDGSLLLQSLMDSEEKS